MENPYLWCMLLFIAIVPYAIVKDLLLSFRKNIKQGDIVGIKFGDYVLNRTVRNVTESEVNVKNFNSNTYVTISKKKVYIPDRFKDVDDIMK